MPTTEQMNERYAGIYRAAREKWGLRPEMAWPYAVLDAYLWAYTGFGAPQIQSGYRDPAYQRSLYERWKAGDPGIQYRPASQSWHMAGLAIDVNKGHPNYPTFHKWFVGWYGPHLQDGSTFGDPGHYAIPIEALRPAPAY